MSLPIILLSLSIALPSHAQYYYGYNGTSSTWRIVTGVVVGVVALTLICWCCVYKRRRVGGPGMSGFGGWPYGSNTGGYGGYAGNGGRFFGRGKAQEQQNLQGNENDGTGGVFGAGTNGAGGYGGWSGGYGGGLFGRGGGQQNQQYGLGDVNSSYNTGGMQGDGTTTGYDANGSAPPAYNQRGTANTPVAYAPPPGAPPPAYLGGSAV